MLTSQTGNPTAACCRTMWRAGKPIFPHQTRRALRLKRGSGFTLIEILIVVVILGILAMIVIPQFSNATHIARENTLKDDLRYLRMQIGVFKAQHRDIAPGYDAASHSVPSEANFLAQMTQYTAEDCTTGTMASSMYRFGPYLTRMPNDPLAEQGSILIIGDGQPMPSAGSLPIANGAVPYGWIYKPQTQEIMANLGGTDNNEVPYASY